MKVSQLIILKRHNDIQLDAPEGSRTFHLPNREFNRIILGIQHFYDLIQKPWNTSRPPDAILGPFLPLSYFSMANNFEGSDPLASTNTVH